MTDNPKRKGIGGHQSAAAQTHTWLTPPHIIEALGPFDLDPCAAPEPRPWPTAGVHYALPHQDGLALPWFGRIWLNPPYGNLAETWLAKLARHARGTALIFARTETAAFHETVWRKADGLLFLNGRLHFHYPDGRRAEANGGAPSVLIAYGADDAERLHDSSLPGAFVGLKAPVLVYLLNRHGESADKEAVGTWRAIVCDALKALGGQARLADIYSHLEEHPKAKGNQHWRAKIRQTLQRAGLEPVAPAQYALPI
ncbi:MAG: adenine methyltransferase [Rhodoblastus sp.]|nr:adenine methyltransferase [Rhodoblastus sp.]